MDDPNKLPEWVTDKLEGMTPKDGKRFLMLYAKANQLAERGKDLDRQAETEANILEVLRRVDERDTTPSAVQEAIVRRVSTKRQSKS